MKVNYNKEREIHSMNTNMIRLMELVNETTKVIDNLRSETATLKEEYSASRQIQLDEMRNVFMSLMSIINKLNENVYVPLNVKSHYTGYNYVICLRRMGQTLICLNDKTSLGILGWEDEYDEIKYNQKMLSGLHYDIDAILDGFDQTEFEIAFTEAVQKILVKQTKIANDNYEYAKRQLNERM